jgi:hypothetical protein
MTPENLYIDSVRRDFDLLFWIYLIDDHLEEQSGMKLGRFLQPLLIVAALL